MKRRLLSNIMFVLVFFIALGVTLYPLISNHVNEKYKSEIVNNVVFPVIDMILAVLLFVKIATCYMEYRKHGQFDFTAPAILFACLLFSLTAPSYIWNIL